MSDTLTRKLDLLREPRRLVHEAINTFHASRYEDVRLTYLQRALDAQKEVARLDAEFTASLEPCRVCGRRVTSPCNSIDGFHENGPWDGACTELIKGPS